MKKLLIVDDERSIIEIVKSYFEDNDYTVLGAENADVAMKKLEENPDLILLDIMMPGTDGIEFCRLIREKALCPIIFLSARTEEASKIKSLAVGGDDYITKPFSIRELYARVEAHLRREQRQKKDPAKVHFGSLWIDYAGRGAGIGDQELSLAKKEFQILEMLSMNSGQAFSHDRIYESIWGYDAEGDANSAVTEHIKRIRKKFQALGAECQIETVWGIGYKWTK